MFVLTNNLSILVNEIPVEEINIQNGLKQNIFASSSWWTGFSGLIRQAQTP